MGTKGTMTEVEKRINKEDLKAYKEYDNNQYSLIPGIQNQKLLYDWQKIKNKEVSFEEGKRRLEQYGYNRFYQNTSFT